MAGYGQKIFNPYEPDRPKSTPKHYRRTSRAEYHCDAGCGEVIPLVGAYIQVGRMRLHEECFERRYQG
jgi:hypothetical protein